MRSFSLLVPMVFATFALAQSPQSFNYQGVARDAVGEPLSAQSIGVELRLRSGSALGPVVYSETHGATTDMFGLFTLHVGEGTPGTGTFSAIDWRSGPYFLEIGLDLSASGIYTSFGTQQLLSVPYALHAGSSGDLPLGTEVGQIMHWDGGAWVADSGLYVHDKRFGIGDSQPEAPLSIKSRDVLKSYFQTGDIPTSQDFAISTDTIGFGIDQGVPGSMMNRVFIQASNGNVGINEGIPDTKLHVSRPASDPLARLSLNEGTGIVTIGPITDNIVADYQGIQARHGEFIGPVLDLSTSTLNLQRLGGDILFHGDDVVESNRVTITSDGKIGVGKTAVEKLEINGAIVVGNTDNVAPSSGTIRWNNSTDDIEGFVGTAWTSLTSGGWVKVDNTDDIVASGDHPKVGIGTALPSAALHVNEDEATTGNSTGVVIENNATTSSSIAADTRIGLHVSTSGQWSSNAGAKSAALVAMATPGGNSAAHANAAAVLGGNVVIGDLTGDQMVGTGGSNVLAIQNGTPPADGLSGGPGSNGAIQFYSADVSGVSTIHVMNGNGDVIKLYKEAPITPAQNLPVDGIYDPSEAIVIENMRTRITELENVLKALGLLTP